jgi:hypothetical protein
LKSRPRRRRAGVLLFLLPFLVILGLVLYQVSIYYLTTPNGTLVVYAQTGSSFYSPKPLTTTATVDGRSESTPFNLTLRQGTYTVQFASIPWFKTPLTKTVSVLSGKTAYAAGEYDPVTVGVTLTNAGFNATSLTVLDSYTPLIVSNQNGSDVVLRSTFFASGARDLFTTRDLTLVFPSPGNYTFVVATTSFSFTVTVI